MDDLISRQAAIDALHMHLMYRMGTDSNKKRLDDWINSLPSAQETHDKRTETHACDCISRQALCEYALNQKDKNITANDIMRFPSAQPEIIRCRDCKLRDTEYCNMAHGFMGMKDDDYCSYAERREVSE